jgi:hypothetical protein
LFVQVQVVVEGPRELVANGELSQYTVEGGLYASWPFPDDVEDDSYLPAKSAVLTPQALDGASIGRHGHATLTGRLEQARLWSAENVSLYLLKYHFLSLRPA